MERKLASIQKIVSLEPIQGADMILKATVLGWEVVVAKKDNLKVGDLVVYCEVDSILPPKPEFEFLRERKFRIKTIKLKGQVSQGICFPLSILPTVEFKLGGRIAKVNAFNEGDNVTEVLGITKYDSQAEFERAEALKREGIHKNRMDKFLKRYAWYRNLIFKPTKTAFPSFIRKTDEDRIQLFPNACEQWKDIPFTVTEKIDGQSATYFCVPNPRKGLFRKKWLFGVCSRNFQLLKEDNSSYWTVANQEGIKGKLISYADEFKCGVIVQGEIIGTKIQGNKYGVKEYEFFVFNVVGYINGNKNVLNQLQQQLFCQNYDFTTVPIVANSLYLPTTIQEIVQYAKGNSILKTDVLREGVVMRNYERNISFKAINPDFLLKYDS